jgi:integrase
MTTMKRHSMGLDIHNYTLKFAQAEGQVRRSELSQHNKDLILAYRDACLLKGTCGKVRLIRVLGVLVLYARLIQKDFDTLTREDVEHLVTRLVTSQPPYSPETLGTYKAILKSFVTWILVPNEFPTKTPPAMVAWITTHVKKRDKHKLERNDLLTPQDIDTLLNVCHNTRDKALISMLWETGCRIAEIGNLQLKHLTKIEHGYSLDVNGKTGQRNPIIVSSAPYLTQWLANHPFRDNPDAPLWVHYQYNKEPTLLRYDTIRNLLARYFERAGIKKPFHPHLFRHSRATYVLANSIFNEQQAKQFFGWAPDSDMLATYSHLIDQDANNAILRENNLTPVQQKAKELLPRICPNCQELNPPKTDYCVKCGAVLDLKKAYEHQQVHDLHEDVTMTLFKILVDKGLIDDAAKAVHDAGLGAALKRLAEHQQAKPTKPGTDEQPAATPASQSRPDDPTPPGQPTPPA